MGLCALVPFGSMCFFLRCVVVLGLWWVLAGGVWGFVVLGGWWLVGAGGNCNVDCSTVTVCRM